MDRGRRPKADARNQRKGILNSAYGVGEHPVAAELPLSSAENGRASPLQEAATRPREIVTAARELFRLHVPEDRHPNQDDGDDPQNNVFAFVLFVGHKQKYTTPQSTVQVPR
jgi:hypothetical protein